MSLNDLCFNYLIEGCIKYHNNKNYDSFDVFRKEIIKGLGIKNLMIYLNEHNTNLPELYQKQPKTNEVKNNE